MCYEDYENAKKTARIVENGNCLLHHDNAPAHTVVTVCDKQKHGACASFTPLIQSGSVGLFLFLRMKRSLKGRRFSDADEVKENTLALNSILPQKIQHCFQQWQKRWDKCTNSHAQYFEGDDFVSIKIKK
ncbi:hypothetical protein X975_15558, partial [Stegodyphus mimosarum]